MRVLSIAGIYPNEINESEGRSVSFLDRALADIGVSGRTIVLRPWAPQWLVRQIPRLRHLCVCDRHDRFENLEVVFARYIHIPRYIRYDLSSRFMAHRAAHIIDRNSWSFDIVHSQSVGPALAAHQLAKRYRVPFILTLRDSLKHLDNNLKEGGDALKERYADMFASVGAVLTHGPSVLEDVSRFLPEGRDIPSLIARNGVDLIGLKRILASLPPREQSSQKRIVSVGNLYRYKGIHENLHALKDLHERGIKSWTYRIVGDGPYRKALEGLANSLGLGAMVTFTGRLPHHEAIREIRDADIFSLPSWAEPFGNVYAEAAVCGTPAIGCHGQGAELTIVDGETGFLVPPKDIGTLAGKMFYLLENPDEARAMGERAREHIKQFTWEQTAVVYKGIMEQVLASSEKRH